jgi:hypothetical protein
MKLLSGYVLNLDRRGAIVDALTKLRPAPEAMETKRAALQGGLLATLDTASSDEPPHQNYVADGECVGNKNL